MTEWSVGALVLYVPTSSRYGSVSWHKVIRLRPRTGYVKIHGRYEAEFDLATGAVEGYREREGYIYPTVERYQEVRAREALVRVVEGKMARVGAVDKLSSELLRKICLEFGVTSVPYDADVPELP